MSPLLTNNPTNLQ